jgi:xylan 1,4-beta-xylosidase
VRLIALALLAACAPAFDVKIAVDAGRTRGPLTPIWTWFGYDEPNYTTMKDGRKLLSQLASSSRTPVYVRTHNLLTSGDGKPALKWGSTNVYTEDAGGRPRYDWTILDQIFDVWIERGMKPLVEIGFMPEALTSGPPPYRHSFSLETKSTNIDGSWAFPPKDEAKWAALIEAWVRHAIERYGKAEVETWYWELWNEANIRYWRGTPEQFHRLYDVTAAAVKRVLPAARFGGPHWASSAQSLPWFEKFLEHCRASQAPLDFVAFHAKGRPEVVDGTVRMGIQNQLRMLEIGFGTIAKFPEYRAKPVIIGESDPEGCAACSARVYPQNAYRNGTLYSSYTAAAFARHYELAERHKINLLGAVTWAFEFEDQPWFDGFRDLATNGVEKPVLNVFRMYGLMGSERIAATSSHQAALDDMLRSGVRERPDVGVIASRGARSVTAMVWHYHDINAPGEEAEVELAISGLDVPRARLTHYRIDRNHSNSWEAWKQMGSPQSPTPQQIAALERAAALTTLNSPEWVDSNKPLRFRLPRQGVSLLTWEW